MHEAHREGVSEGARHPRNAHRPRTGTSVARLSAAGRRGPGPSTPGMLTGLQTRPPRRPPAPPAAHAPAVSAVAALVWMWPALATSGTCTNASYRERHCIALMGICWPQWVGAPMRLRIGTAAQRKEDGTCTHTDLHRSVALQRCSANLRFQQSHAR